MNDARHTALTHEWVTLQNNHEQYERSALIVKLLAIIVFTISAIWPHGATLRGGIFFGVLCFVVCVLWAQESILRTSQARLSRRLLRVEACLRTPDEDLAPGTSALQLHSEWQASRAGNSGLLVEYSRNALRPTVAFPHAVLAVLLLLLALCH